MDDLRKDAAGLYGTWDATQRVVKIEDADGESGIAIISEPDCGCGREYVTRYENLHDVYELDENGHRTPKGEPKRACDMAIIIHLVAKTRTEVL